jgi:23S rRNA (cytidine2498-2'-O)-methyltransferase
VVAAGGECAGGWARGALSGSAYLAAAGFAPQLAEELRRAGVAVSGWHGELAISPDPPVAVAWALNTWLAPREIAAPSIGQAAEALRRIQRNWAGYQVSQHRRASLITARLPHLAPKPLRFPEPPPAGHLGAWTLLAPDLILASAAQSSKFVNGEPRFVEDRARPPSRAYLKLFEALTVFGDYPGAGDVCLDLGAAPGGWSWVLAGLGATVVAVDKAELAPAVAALPNVRLRRESAFGLEPAGEAADWVFSDIIAYPGRLLRLVQGWIEAGRVRRIVCTVKFQGETDFAAMAAFAAIPGGDLRHLFHNKHEVTFFWRRCQGPGARIQAPDRGDLLL